MTHEIVGNVERKLIVGANILEVVGDDKSELQNILSAYEGKRVRVTVEAAE